MSRLENPEMKTTWLWPSALFLSVLTCAAVARGADEPQPPPNRPDREALRERARNLSPEERQKLVKEFRERNGLGRTNQSEWEKKREEFRSLPPGERAARMRELRESMAKDRGGFRMLTPEQREAKRDEMKQRVDTQIEELRKKKADASITESEQRRMEHMEQISRRLAQQAARPGRPVPQPAWSRGARVPPLRTHTTPRGSAGRPRDTR